MPEEGANPRSILPEHMDGSTEYGWDLTWPLTRMEKRKITQAQISQDLGKSSSLLGAQTKSESDVVPASATPRPLDLAEEEPSAWACSEPAWASWTTLASLTSSE